MNHLDWRGVEGFCYRRLSNAMSNPFKSVPGAAISGVITAVGEGFQKESNLKVGQEVMGICSPPYLDNTVFSFNLKMRLFQGMSGGRCATKWAIILFF